MDHETNCVTKRLTALIARTPIELTPDQLRQIELVTARFNENLRANAVDYDETAEMELEYA